MSDIVQTRPVDVEATLDDLAARYRMAGNSGVRLLTLLGTRADNLLDRLPAPARAGLETATEQALHAAMRAAAQSRSVLPDQSAATDRWITTMMGAAGGFGGLPGALVELPATTTMLLRTIQSAASENAFDPASPSVRFDCVRVFAASGPLAHDDGADLGFLSLRLALSGGAAQKLIATVAPKLAAVLGQKLVAQSVPVLGAVAGASVNFVFTRYYQDMAHVHFGIRRLAIDADRSEAALLEGLEARMLGG